ncbi:MAG: efflux RND transporter permease subunit [Nannocystaceae bacterium]|nr:efflux RND transporter permease subunit [Myxococcales bacterium]
MKLAEISVKRSIFAAMLIAALMVFGLFSLPKIGVELFPDVEFPVITTTVVYPGADPGTMESKVADEVEEALQAIGGVKRLTSRNYEGVTSVILEMELEIDGDQALQEVRDKVSAIERQLPSGIDPPVVQKFNVGATPVLTIALAGDLEIREMTRLAKDVVKQRLQQIPGVGTVDVVGGQEREIQVLVDPNKMTGRGLTVEDVARAIQSQNVEIPAGYLKQTGSELTVKTKGEVTSLDEIADIIVRGTVRVRDVAEVVDTVEEARSGSYLNGGKAVSLVVRKQSGSNVVALAHEAREAMTELEPLLTQRGVSFAVPSDMSVFVEHSINDVKVDLILGAVLTVIIILVFLHDIRATLIAALAIPTSLVATFAFMEWMGFSFNNVTMLALSLSIGILVDDAIVVIENIYRHLEMGKTKRQAALDATSEIGFAVIATTLSIVAVFVPVAYMKGIVGRFFFQFGLTVAAAVLISMLVSFTLTPMLSSRFMQAAHGQQAKARGLFGILLAPFGFLFRPFARAFDRAFAGLERLYAAILRFCLRHPWLTIATAVAALVGSIVLVSMVPSEFITEDDRSEFAVNVELPTGTGLATTVAYTEAVAEDIRAHLPGIRDTFTSVGGGAQGQVNRGQISVTLASPHSRTYTQEQAMQWARARLAGLDATITIAQIDAVGGDAGFRSQPVQFAIRGNDFDEMVAAADRLKERLAAKGGFVDLDTSYRGGKPELAVHVDRNRAADLGVPVASIAQGIRALMAGDPVSTFKDDGEVYDIVVQMPETDRSRFEHLAGLKVRSNNGQLINLANVVRTKREEGPSEIERQGRQRQVVLLANLEGITLGDAQKIIDELAADPEVIPPHLTTGWLGNAEMMVESFVSMGLALVLAIILVFMILAAQFNSLVQPVVIMISLPLSVIGAFGGLFISGMTLNMFSFIGIIMLMGLVTKTAILLVDFANGERAKGRSVVDALVEAGMIRMRPIFMTAGATIFGMLPVALAMSEGGESRAPMAVCVIGGMITSTALTLVVIPVVYLLFERARGARVLRWIGGALFGAGAHDEEGDDELQVDITVQDEVEIPIPAAARHNVAHELTIEEVDELGAEPEEPRTGNSGTRRIA